MPDRREFLTAVGGGLAAAAPAAETAPRGGSGLGVVIHSYPARSGADRGFADPLRFLAFCRERGAAGVQLPLGVRESDYARQLRAEAERHGMYVEGSAAPPRDRADLARFEAELRTARECGAAVVRTVLSGGRRYEVFKCAEDFREFRGRALRALVLARPVAARHRVRLAVENHKDFRSDELAALMGGVGGEWVGVCVDTGNNIALLEDPLRTARALAPWAAACHLKDMGVAPAADGFLLAEVPLGDGFLDLREIIAVLREARPEVRLSLEMITRDPLRVPCLTEGYWATLDNVPGRDLAWALRTVRDRAGRGPLPEVGRLGRDERFALEDGNVRRSLAYAKDRLGL
jgi:sugar phosphate isomerase/epimerase